MKVIAINQSDTNKIFGASEPIVIIGQTALGKSAAIKWVNKTVPQYGTIEDFKCISNWKLKVLVRVQKELLGSLLKSLRDAQHISNANIPDYNEHEPHITKENIYISLSLLYDLTASSHRK